MSIISSSLRLLRDWLRFAVVTLAIFLVIRGFVLEAFTIPSASMEGTLLVGDFLFVNKALYGAEIPGTGARLPAIRDPERGEVVVFRPPHDRSRVYVKRLVGVPGDALEMREKTLFRNGEPQVESYVHHQDRGGDAIHPGMKWQLDFLSSPRPGWRYAPSRDNWGPIRVPPNRYFVLGDNRDNSEDSRYWGFIGRKDLRGRPGMVYLSLRENVSLDGGWLGRVRWDRVGYFVR